MSAELKKEIENIDFDLSELKSLEISAKRVNVKTLLTAEVNQLTQKRNQLLKELKEKYSLEDNTKTDKQSAMGTVVVTNYMWDQSNDFVKIYIEAAKSDNLSTDQVSLKYHNKRSFSVVFGKYKFTISKLFDDIDAENSYFKITKSGKLIIFLKKCLSKTWTTIDQKEDKFKKAVEEEKDSEKDSLADPSAGLMKLMKQMYDEGDDDMKRTIAKSWYESRQKTTTDVDLKSDDSFNI